MPSWRQAFIDGAALRRECRSLTHAADFPVLERCRYVAIWRSAFAAPFASALSTRTHALRSANLDEFFQARITAFYDEAGARQEGKRTLTGSSRTSPSLIPHAALLPGHQEVLSMAQQDAILSNDIYSQLVRDLQATGTHAGSRSHLIEKFSIA